MDAQLNNRRVWLVRLSLVGMYLDMVDSQYTTPAEKQEARNHIFVIGQWAGKVGPFDAPEPTYKNAFNAWERIAKL